MWAERWHWRAGGEGRSLRALTPAERLARVQQLANDAGLGAAPSSPRTAGYGVLKSELEGTGLQANHLNQNAAFRGVIPENEGLAVALRGNAITDVSSPHYNFHRSLEQFWDQYRPDGALFNTRPTNAQYGQALQRALEADGFSPAQAADLAAQAAGQRAAYGLSETGLVPRIPGRLNQKPPPSS